MDNYDIWFTRINISLREKLNLVNRFKTAYSVFENIIINKNMNNIVSLKCYHELLKAWNKDEIAKIQSVIKDKNIQCVKYDEELYPHRLKNISDYPYMLYYLGDISKLNDLICVSIVGSRNATAYGMNVTSLIAERLSKNNIGIVSGMARGIDSCSQNMCVKANGFTCAVLGCGVDIIYPKSNTKLYNNLIKNGCIISEFPPLTPPFSYNFPIRNRIISGLSDVVIVVEASLKSGTLITANCALEQGKDVLAVPGSIFSDKSKGTNKLIRDGAFPFTDFEDIELLLGINFKEDKHYNKEDSLDKTQKKILSFLSDNPLHIDDLCRKVSIDINRLYDVLFEMQFQKVISCINGNYYVKLNDKI